MERGEGEACSGLESHDRATIVAAVSVAEYDQLYWVYGCIS